MRLTAAIFGVALLVTLAVVAVGCGPPPDLAEKDVIGFVVGPDPTVHMDAPLPAPTQSLHRLVTAYNAAAGARWEGDTTPPLFAVLELRDATRIVISFSSQFPKDCAQVSVRSPKTNQSKEYRIKSPDLLPAVLVLAGDSIDLKIPR